MALRSYILSVASDHDAWESAGWEAAWEQTDELEREQVLGLARRLADQRRRQQAEHVAELEELKRGLRERAAEVSRRELEVERRYRELEDRDARAKEGRLSRPFRRAERPAAPDAEQAYATEILTRREAELEERQALLDPRERTVTERETALRARELVVEEAELSRTQRSAS